MTSLDTRRVAVTGGSGFVGSRVVAYLTRRGARVKALARQGDVRDARETVPGDLFDDAALDTLLRGCDTLIHLVGIIRENPRRGQTFDRVHHEAVKRLVARAEAHGVHRLIHMSALGTRAHARSDYHHTKWLGECAVRDSALTWTIFRPSLILGPGGEFARMLRDFWTKPLPPFVPYFGKGLLGLRGSGRVQPISVEDVAHCFVEALSRPAAERQTYELGGPDAMDWPTMYRRAKAVIDGARNKPVLPIPVWQAKLLASLPIPGLPFNTAQVVMAEEDSTCDMGPAARDFAFTPMPMEAALRG